MIKKINYYQVLEISENASFEDIKKAFREKAKIYHPDRQQNSKFSEDAFKMANEAYQTLSCEKRREQYDRTLKMRKKVSLEDVYEDLGKEYEKQNKGVEVVKVILDVEETYFGCEKVIEYPSRKECSQCNGTGAENGKVRMCPKCNGKGVLSKQVGFMDITRDCENCEGKGVFYISPCKSCNGEGVEFEKKAINVSIPRGINQNDKIRLEVEDGLEVVLMVEVSNDMEYIRQEYSVYHKVNLSLKEMILGCVIELDFFGGVFEVEIPENSKHRDLVVVKGRGFPVLNTEEYGDFVVELNLVYPELNEQNKELIRALKG